jgi:hypothetical protein
MRLATGFCVAFCKDSVALSALALSAFGFTFCGSALDCCAALEASCAAEMRGKANAKLQRRKIPV